MKPALFALMSALTATTALAQSAPVAPMDLTPGSLWMEQTDDPYLWLEDVDGTRAMAWVHGQNAKSARRLESDPRYETFRREALAIFTAEDRIPLPHLPRGRGRQLLAGQDPREGRSGAPPRRPPTPPRTRSGGR